MGARLEIDRGEGWLRWTAAFYGLAFALHTADHARRGTGVTTHEVLVLGGVAGVLQLLAIAAVFVNHRWAPWLAALVGIPDGTGILLVHLLPRWSSFSDAFPGAHGTGVTALSWASAILEILAAFAFAAAGLSVLRGARSGARSRPGTPSWRSVPT
jgi:hypothetical protein